VSALQELSQQEEWSDTKIAIASRTSQGDWARSLLQDFRIGDDAGRSIADIVSYAEIYTGSKIKHFGSLRKRSGVDYAEMLFFDDARGGKYGNCEPVARLGCCSAHCPDGLTAEVWSNAIRKYAALKAEGAYTGVVVPPPPKAIGDKGVASLELADGSTAMATVVRWFEEKQFGFAKVVGRRQDVFFHRSALPPGAAAPRPGEHVRVRIGFDRQGRMQCMSVSCLDAVAGGVVEGGAPMVRLKCFSMNQPFASLVAHGHKTLETRNGTMFEGTAGKYVLLHVGRRTYPDGGKHREILARSGCTSADIDRLTSLPSSSFTRGMVVALLELGETRLADVDARSAVNIENAACAYGKDMGRYLTEVRRATWLEDPIAMPGQAGLFDVSIPKAALPECWSIDAEVGATV
jgi:cold shock CspA family protein